MKRQANLFITIALIITLLNLSNEASAKSVYVIINHVEDLIGIYEIQGNQIEYQRQFTAPQHATRAIDLSMDSLNGYIFLTYERSNVIEIINAKTMVTEDEPVKVPGATNLAAIIYDAAKQRVYTVVRRKNFALSGFSCNHSNFRYNRT